MTRTASTSDRDDPLNYVSFDDFVAGASSPWSLSTLSERWNAAHPEALVLPQGVPQAAPNITPISTPISAEDCGFTRVFAAIQLFGGGIEVIVGGGALLAPEPTVTKVVGAVVLVHGIDTLQSSFRTIVSCDRTATFTQVGASSAAQYFGASPQTAQTIGVVTDVGIGVGGTFGVGMLSRVGPGTAQLVHLTNAERAAAIRGSQTLGLGRSTVYAGPESLAQARGWSILARTGIMPAEATEAILLPSQAGRSFLVVQPIGPFSAWQSINGTVFSAGAGSFNLATGVFTRSGAAVNQIAVYSIDMSIMATVRAAPSLVQGAN